MKDQYKWVRNQVLKQSPKWVKRLRLGEWEIEHVFLDSFFGDDGEEDFKVTAVTESRHQYYEAKIKWYLPSAVRHDKIRLEQTLVHELCHVLLSAEQSMAERIREVGGPESEAVYELFCENRETSTELTARALWKAWVGK